MASDKPSTIPPRSSRAQSARPPARRTRSPRTLARTAPTVTRSFVVEVLPQNETHPEILARITPTDRAAKAATDHGFRFSGAFMDVVSDLLVEMVREKDEKK